VKTVVEARAILRAGADKVTVNTAALTRPTLLSEIAAEFGAQAVVLAIDAKRCGDHWEAFVRGGRETSGRDALEWACRRRGKRRGRNFADLHGPRWYAERVRLRAYVRSSVPRSSACDRLGGADKPADFLASVPRRPRRCGTGSLYFFTRMCSVSAS